MSAALIAGLSLGLLGSFHCIGMCGPIALALPVHRHPGPRKLLLIVTYNAGRLLTYALYGAVAGLAGKAMLLATSGQLLSIVAGVVIVLSAFISIPLNARARSFSFFRKLQSSLSGLLRARKTQSLFLIGVLNGVLPCGLVYMALAMAVAAGTPQGGAAAMAMFGAGTLPVMVALPYAGSLISLKFRNQARKAVPFFIAFTGILLILRGLGLGIPYVSPSPNKGGASCHTTAQKHSTKNSNHLTCTGHASALSK